MHIKKTEILLKMFLVEILSYHINKFGSFGTITFADLLLSSSIVESIVMLCFVQSKKIAVVKLSCDSRFQRAFTACSCVFKAITLV